MIEIDEEEQRNIDGIHVDRIRGTSNDMRVLEGLTFPYENPLNDQKIEGPTLTIGDTTPPKIQGYLMSLAEMKEKNVQACDILQMLQFPFITLTPNQSDSGFDSKRRLIYFIPGREAKYVKIPE